MVVIPRTRMVALAPGRPLVRVTWTPGIEPWSAWERPAAWMVAILPPSTAAMEPVRSFFLTVP